MATRWPLAGFVVKVFAWLPATFVVWYFAAPILMWPAALLVDAGNMPGSRTSCRASRSPVTLSFATTLRPGPPGPLRTGSIDVDMLLYAYGLPLYAALVLAAREL